MGASYEVVCRHLSWWRGEVHRWSTVYPLYAPSEASSWTIANQNALATIDSQMCYFGVDGGEGHLYQADFYSKDLGGAPILTTTYGSATAPGDGSLPSGDCYLTSTAIMNTPLETCMLLSFNAGFGRSGKPVYFRKFIHAVPQSAAVNGDQDISDADQASLVAMAETINPTIEATGLVLGNARRLAGTAFVEAWYVNHQMPRGRRHKKLATSAFKPGSYVVISPPGD